MCCKIYQEEYKRHFIKDIHSDTHEIFLFNEILSFFFCNFCKLKIIKILAIIVICIYILYTYINYIIIYHLQAIVFLILFLNLLLLFLNFKLSFKAIQCIH